MKIKDFDFCFENSIVRIVADKNNPEIKLGGFSIGPFAVGNEYEVFYWVGQELEKAGIAHFRLEDRLDVTKLYKVLWKESNQIAGQISELSDDFYPELRRYLLNIKGEIAVNPEKVHEFERARQTARDIVNFRLKKIILLAAGPIQTDQTLKKITPEERVIYNQLSKMINDWKTQIIEFE